jgi:AcrR family transcriptional regulator
MIDRDIPGSGYDNVTRSKILDEALKLFAIKGYGAVSIRDICRVVGIKESSLYYHYEGKEALFEDIMQRFEKGYRHYFAWLKEANLKAESLEELMDNMFNKEVFEIIDPCGILGMSLAIKEQHNNESVRKRVFELFHSFSIESMKEDFDRLIEKGVIPPADTETIAMIIMSNVMVINDIRIHEYTGAVASVNCTRLYDNLRKFIVDALT